MTQPINSIDSELAGFFKPYLQPKYVTGSKADTYIITAYGMTEALKAISTKYVSRKEIEEAIDNLPNDNTDCSADYLGNSDGCSDRDHHYRSGRFDMLRETEEYLRAKLLPPTKGGKDE